VRVFSWQNKTENAGREGDENIGVQRQVLRTESQRRGNNSIIIL